ncbi:MAG: LytTR family DNA-binding domain-containing protein [Paludibacteraceae bacterium]|nr:LytTR family DNA-binding domain-containing protein [Paludibacteraceae bacterium]
MTLNCIIIDDEPLALGLMESYVKKTPFLNLVGKFENAMEAMSTLKENPPHLLFLDIQMPELNGLEFSKLIKDKTKIIFTTAFQQYALEGYKVNALDYLMKPISYPDFLEAANKALSWYQMTSSENKENGNTEEGKEDRKRSIFVKSDYKLVQIDLDKITHIEGLKDYVKIFVEGENYPILSLMSMKSLEAMLPSDQFIRVHRSFIVQPQKIKVIERNRIVFGKEYIPISDSYKDSFQEFLNKYSIL